MATPKILLVGKYSPDFETLRSDLTRSGYEILTSRELKEALRILDSTRLEWVLSDVHLEKGNGIDLCWSVRNLSRQPHIPFVILSEIDDEEVRLNAYRAGANLYLVKPISPRGLLVRLEAIRNWQKRVQQHFAASARLWTGTLQEFSLLDLVQLLNLEQKTGALWLSSGFSRGVLYFEEGEIQFARLGKLEGEDALFAMSEWKTGQFDFESTLEEEKEKNVHLPTVKLILQIGKRADERKNDAQVIQEMDKNHPQINDQ